MLTQVSITTAGTLEEWRVYRRALCAPAACTQVRDGGAGAGLALYFSNAHIQINHENHCSQRASPILMNVGPTWHSGHPWSCCKASHAADAAATQQSHVPGRSSAPGSHCGSHWWGSSTVGCTAWQRGPVRQWRTDRPGSAADRCSCMVSCECRLPFICCLTTTDPTQLSNCGTLCLQAQLPEPGALAECTVWANGTGWGSPPAGDGTGAARQHDAPAAPAGALRQRAGALCTDPEQRAGCAEPHQRNRQGVCGARMRVVHHLYWSSARPVMFTATGTPADLLQLGRGCNCMVNGAASALRFSALKQQVPSACRHHVAPHAALQSATSAYGRHALSSHDHRLHASQQPLFRAHASHLTLN